ncbi:GtrA family protein [Fumia xinanensis]|uniref:GtrA family protein n=1 Tax=Fumia xinanensis TaxID=2763659 RepID=UPI002016108E
MCILDGKELLQKNRELISYLFFGVLTTLVNYVSYLLFAPLFGTTTVPTVIAWILSVIFAYVTNRIFVFRSKVRGWKALSFEMVSFFGARALSGVLDVGFMWLFADYLGFNDKWMKLVSNVFVIIFNYAASKLVIFRKKENGAIK